MNSKKQINDIIAELYKRNNETRTLSTPNIKNRISEYEFIEIIIAKLTLLK